MTRLATENGEVSNFHMDMDPAHTILAKACLGVLPQYKDDVEGCTPKGHPLARHTKHRATHFFLSHRRYYCFVRANEVIVIIRLVPQSETVSLCFLDILAELQSVMCHVSLAFFVLDS